jgi:hypothetical protein
VAIGFVFSLSMLGCLMVLMVRPFRLIDNPIAMGIYVAGFVLAIPSFVGLCAFVRCPRCRVRLFWHAVSKEVHPGGLNGMLLWTHCPFCGYPASGRDSAQSNIDDNAPHDIQATSQLENVVSLQGPVERIDGRLVLRIPLDAGGDQLVDCSRGISEVQGEYLTIAVQEWLAGVLRIEEGDLVVVDNANGKFNLRPVNARPIH